MSFGLYESGRTTLSTHPAIAQQECVCFEERPSRGPGSVERASKPSRWEPENLFEVRPERGYNEAGT